MESTLILIFTSLKVISIGRKKFEGDNSFDDSKRNIYTLQ